MAMYWMKFAVERVRGPLYMLSPLFLSFHQALNPPDRGSIELLL